MSEKALTISADELSYSNSLQEQAKSLDILRGFWSQHLSTKYFLKQGDSVTLEGVIIRAPEPIS